MKPEAAHIKGTDLVIVKTMLKDQIPGGVEAFLPALSESTGALFQSLLSGTWVPVAAAAEIMEQAVKVLFPGQADGLEQLGRVCSRQAFQGIYKTFLRISSLSFFLNRVPMVWGAYYSVGKAVITRVDEKIGGVLEVSGAPELPIQSLRVLSGFALQALEMAGAQNVSCQLNTENPQAWQWTFRWNA